MNNYKFLRGSAVRAALIASLSVAGAATITTTVSVEPANAIKRQRSTSLSCNKIQAMLRSEGQIYLWEPKSKRVTRFVGNAIYCDANRSMRYTSVKSKDKPFCRVTICSGSDMLHDHTKGRGSHGHHGGRW